MFRLVHYVYIKNSFCYLDDKINEYKIQKLEIITMSIKFYL